ncbi:hypothetical protein F5146DRAFT_1043168 [Armillaria mellea]|nr:hypothetical protein F5146DRAFT_1043168 [Armillaria mellea]
MKARLLGVSLVFRFLPSPTSLVPRTKSASTIRSFASAHGFRALVTREPPARDNPPPPPSGYIPSVPTFHCSGVPRAGSRHPCLLTRVGLNTRGLWTDVRLWPSSFLY